MDGRIYLPLRFYVYGERAPAAVARADPVWQAWVNERLPMPSEVTAAD